MADREQSKKTPRRPPRQENYTKLCTESLLLHRPDGSVSEISLIVGAPYRLPGEPETWACPCELTGLYSRFVDICGGSSLQALCLALSLLRKLLETEIERGGRISFPGDEEGSEGPSEAEEHHGLDLIDSLFARVGAPLQRSEE